MANMITLTVGDNVTTEMFKSYVDNKAYSQIDLRDILPVRPIEMTEEAYNELNKLRSHNYDLDIVNSRAMFEYNPLKQYTTEELAQAWLHPDTIKIKG